MQQDNESLYTTFSYRLITTILLFGLVIELLLPWVHSGEWSLLFHPNSLIWMSGLMLLLGLMQPRLLTFIIFGTLIGVTALMLIYRRDELSILQWLMQLLPQLFDHVQASFSYGLWFMSDELRTIMLFIGWLILVPSIQAMIWQYQLSFALFSISLIYLIVLHVMLGFDVWLAAIRVIVEGLLLLALTTIPKLYRKQLSERHSKIFSRNQYVSVLLFISIIVFVGVWSSYDKEKDSASPVWTEIFEPAIGEELSVWNQKGQPLKHMNSNSLRSNANISGYSADDSILGERLKQSDKIVFYGWSTIDHYWRGEALAEYTGKGWKPSNHTVALRAIVEDSTEAVAELMPAAANQGIIIRQQVTYVEPQLGLPLFQSGSKGVVLELNADNPARKLSNYIEEAASGALFAPVQNAAVTSYTVLTEVPLTNLDKLRELKPTNEELAQRAWELEMLQPYLQLPEDLPERIAALSAEVSGGGLTNRYDQVKAVEQYLKSNFKYSLNSKQPADDEDFVDHFLFEQQRGYCVHFASAMVIMLRTQDIPARYVKGYHMGTAIEERTGDDKLVQTHFEVREKDAHAWVEVYFPSVGWVAFDPTPSASPQPWQSLRKQVDELGEQALAQVNKWTSLLTSMQWYYAGIGVFMSICTALLLRLLWKQVRYQADLRKYTRLMKQIAKLQVVLEKNKSNKVMSRCHADASLHRRAASDLPLIVKRAEKRLEKLIIERIIMLEEAYHIYNTAATWRQRIELLCRHVDGKQQHALAWSLQQLEQLMFGKECTLPLPQELSSYLHQIRATRLGKGKVKVDKAKLSQHEQQVDKPSALL